MPRQQLDEERGLPEVLQVGLHERKLRLQPGAEGVQERKQGALQLFNC